MMLEESRPANDCNWIRYGLWVKMLQASNALLSQFGKDESICKTSNKRKYDEKECTMIEIDDTETSTTQGSTETSSTQGDTETMSTQGDTETMSTQDVAEAPTPQLQNVSFSAPKKTDAVCKRKVWTYELGDKSRFGVGKGLTKREMQRKKNFTEKSLNSILSKGYKLDGKYYPAIGVDF
eukprot:9245553-Ditylum_brightwellii.AAC.2